jgi:16S rRNA G1207 methylase RsmC
MQAGTSHYFSADPVSSPRSRELALRVPGAELRLHTASGVFSATDVDRGTRVLLEHAPLPAGRGMLLDLGCGYGPIAIALAARRKRSQVWAVDVNNRAVELTRANAARNSLNNVVACRPEDVPADVVFDAVYSNPPIRIGKPALHALLLTWLRRLRPGARGFLVVHKNLGADSLAAWLTAQALPTDRLVSCGGYRVLAVDAHVPDAGPQ